MNGRVLRRGLLSALLVGIFGVVADSAVARNGAAVSHASSSLSVNHEASSPIVVRQILGYGRQNTWIAGVKTAPRGSAWFGRAGQVTKRLGSDWTCKGGVLSWRHDAVMLELKSLMGPSADCNTEESAITYVRVNAPGGRLATDVGGLRVGQTWRSVPKSLKARVVQVVRAGPSKRVGTVYWVGRFQDVCGRPRVDADDRRPLMAIGVTRGGVVKFFAVRQRIIEGVDCP